MDDEGRLREEEESRLSSDITTTWDYPDPVRGSHWGMQSVATSDESGTKMITSFRVRDNVAFKTVDTAVSLIDTSITDPQLTTVWIRYYLNYSW